MLSLQNISANIGPSEILRSVSLEVPDRTLAGLIGRNGAGKTTLMRTVMGLLPAHAGSLTFDGKDLIALPAHERVALGLGYMPEDRRLVPEFTAEDNIFLPVWAKELGGARGRLDFIFDVIHELRPLAKRPAAQLSGGQQKLVALARALMCGRKMLLLDEPFEGVAPVLARRLAEILARLKAEGVAIVLADSSGKHIVDLLDRAFAIERGAVTAVRL
jgi:branched-chain amino acid transport system ATP-binding protein